MLARELGDEVPRARDFVELMSGCGELSRQLRNLVWLGAEFDCGTHHHSEDINKLEGLLWATLLTLSIKAKGILTAAPKCSTWGRTALFTMGREQHGLSVLGYAEERADVAEANVTAEHVAFLLTLCTCRNVFMWLEQPTNSSLERHPAMRFALAVISATRVHTWQGGFGHEMPKPTWMYTTLPAAVHHHLVAPRPDMRAPEGEFHARSGRWWHGTARLQSSEHYPPDFARAVALALLDAQA